MRREGCEICELLAFVKELQPDEDYHPRYQDEYQRLWHEAAAEVERQREALGIVSLRVDDALSPLYGIDYDEGSRIDRAVRALERLRDEVLS